MIYSRGMKMKISTGRMISKSLYIETPADYKHHGSFIKIRENFVTTNKN